MSNTLEIREIVRSEINQYFKQKSEKDAGKIVDDTKKALN